jgi:transcriptional antiterminator NusG
MEWYTIRVISGKEQKIQEIIKQEVERNNLSESVQDILVPTENKIEMKDGKKKIKTKVFFPGYILVNMDLDNKSKYLIENIDGVMSFVGPKGSPQPVKPEEISRIIGVSENGEDREMISIPFKVGDPIKIIDGPFLDFSGFVQEVNNEKQKLKVSVSLFGKPTPVELDYLQVEKEK